MHKRLGEILVAEGIIDAAQLQEALSSCAASGARLGEHLVEQKRCDEAQIVGALAKQLGIPIATLSPEISVPDSVLAYLPAELARARCLMPMGFTADGALELVLADPTDMDLLDEVRFQTGCALAPRVGPTSALTAAIARHYPLAAVEISPPSPQPGLAQDLEARVSALEAEIEAIKAALAGINAG
ncbi:hypothetical protein KKF91_00440 [Myxococcota bacterium]|nr:hypothetical protein [Myxococcota bacterium]MBU1429002.1 hypothetical protein [Myxococcota bacterium]MBU1896991.1 hypothetical protein [Myxococcota bacterium]